MEYYKTKIIIFILLLIILSIIFLYSIFGLNISFLSVEKIKSTRTFKENLISELKINKIDAIYEKVENTFYYNIDSSKENSNYILKLDLEPGYKYKVLGGTLNVIDVDYSKTYNIIIYNNKYYSQVKLKLVNLPIINIETNENITEYDTNSKFKYINASTNEIYDYNIMIHIRGESSKLLDKKSYKINIYDENYEDTQDADFLNFDEGSSFVLDALYKDPSKIRNALAINLWNDISSDFSNFSMNSEFVEVFINNEYNGLYLFTEPVNRNKLKLDKISKSSSMVIKADNWITLNKNINYKNINTKNYLTYEIKYPNSDIYYEKIWEFLFEHILDYYDSKINNTYEIISSSFNLKNYVDIVIFNSFINNGDNRLIKNIYYYTNDVDDGELFIQPWDMELSFGLHYDNKSNILSKTTMDDYNTIPIVIKEKYADEVNKLIVNRYYELRNNILTNEYFDEYLDNYAEILSKGAASRDSNKWYEYDISSEIENIKNWVHNRFDYFDNYIEEIKNGL